MKNLTIQLPFDEAKLEALRLALEAKDIFLEDEVERFLNSLYKRTVAKQVQVYLDSRAASTPKPTRPTRQEKPAPTG